ncbi:MAG: SDR family oxidoreductase [Candidatus Dormibacteraceae bacterium]
MDVGGAVVVVTGAGSGIGRALCERFAAERAGHVVASDLDAGAAEETARRIGGDRVTSRHLDVTDEQAVRSLVEEVRAAHGAVDLYCSNAGILAPGGLEVPLSQWQRSWEVHVLAHLYAARALLPGWFERGRGYLLATISAAALLNEIDSLPYAATKSAGLSLLEWLSITYGDRGIRCSALCPQGVRTAMLNEDNFLAAEALTPEAVAEATIAGLRDERFLILPHPEVAEYFRRRATDYDRWLRGMRRLHARVTAQEG